MSNDYPRMLFKFPGNEEMHGARFATMIVDDEDAHVLASMDGWADTTTEARAHAEKPKAEPVAPVVEAEPDRDALKAEATALGIEFPKNVPTEKLVELIAEAKAKE